MTSLNFLSPDSKCHSFDHRANGYARGEGTVVVIIKTLAEALKDGDVIRAVIRGTGVNQDGKTPGITLPSAAAQEELIRTTYKNAGLGFEETNYFEAHGVSLLPLPLFSLPLFSLLLFSLPLFSFSLFSLPLFSLSLFSLSLFSLLLFSLPLVPFRCLGRLLIRKLRARREQLPEILLKLRPSEPLLALSARVASPCWSAQSKQISAIWKEPVDSLA
jgi:hypothetical protein